MATEQQQQHQPTIAILPEQKQHKQQQQQQHTTTTTTTRLSSTWEADSEQPQCTECATEFTALNRRHHCRLCGKIFCNDCSKQRSLIPPSSIVLIPEQRLNYPGTVISNHNHNNDHNSSSLSFTPSSDPHRTTTYNASDVDIPLYGKGLEERSTLAREPLRVCDLCCEKLRPVQAELRSRNSNAVRYNSIDPTDVKRLFNSPLAFTLGHEVRKAAYTLNNLLPLPKRMNLLSDLHTSSYRSNNNSHYHHHNSPSPSQQCATDLSENCSTISPNLSNLDGVRIPARLLDDAKGIAILTVIKAGCGVAVECGTGLVVARVGLGWSAPSAIGTVGMGWGALIGAQVSDHVFLLMTDAAVEMMASDDGSLQLGADVGVAIGPLGRAFEADFGATINGGSGGVAAAPIYTYSLSKGFYVGASLDGKIIATRQKVNERFYGASISAKDLLNGEVPSPPAAQPLYDALKRCGVYARESGGGGMGGVGRERMGGSRGGGGERRYGEVGLEDAETVRHPGFAMPGDFGVSADLSFGQYE